MPAPVLLTALMPLLIEAGAPLLAGIVRAKGGDGAARVVEAVGAALGTGADPGRIVERIRAEPEVAAAAVRTVESERAAEWLDLLRAGAASAEAVNVTMRAETAAGSVLQRIWRPVFGLLYAVAFGALSLAIVGKIVTGDIATLAAASDASALLLGLYGMGASVLGVYVWQRSGEKKCGRN